MRMYIYVTLLPTYIYIYIKKTIPTYMVISVHTFRKIYMVRFKRWMSAYTTGFTQLHSREIAHV